MMLSYRLIIGGRNAYGSGDYHTKSNVFGGWQCNITYSLGTIWLREVLVVRVIVHFVEMATRTLIIFLYTANLPSISGFFWDTPPTSPVIGVILHFYKILRPGDAVIPIWYIIQSWCAGLFGELGTASYLNLADHLPAILSIGSHFFSTNTQHWTLRKRDAHINILLLWPLIIILGLLMGLDKAVFVVVEAPSHSLMAGFSTSKWA